MRAAAETQIKQEALYRARALKEELRNLYRNVHSSQASTYLNRWCANAPRYANLGNLISMIFLCHGGIPGRLLGRFLSS